MFMDIKQAVTQWTEILPPESVLTDEAILQEYETATYHTPHSVVAILKPHNKEQLQQIVKIASKHKAPLYPISTGKNWGYGSSVPTSNNCTIVDLGKMNKILDFDQDLAYVTLEPGVTQKQLYDFLQSKNAPLWIDATGSSSQCSIIGNTLERGFGHTPYGDHFSNVCGLEVILASGESFHTGFGRFSNAEAANVYKWGVGAHLDGLFSQSNFGIISKMTIWLMPAPEYTQVFFCNVNKDELSDLVNSLRPLRLNGTLKSAMHIVNAHKAVSAFGQYPWKEVNDVTPLPNDWLEKQCKKSKIGGWNASGALYGTKAEVALARKKLKNALKHIKSVKFFFLDDRLIKIAKMIKKPYQWLTGVDLEKALEIVEPLFALKQGIPSNTFLPSTYWRKKTPAPAADEADPDKDKCGLLWLAPIAPMTGQHAVILEKIIEDTLIKYGFDPAISMTLLTERCIDSVIAITYDRERPGEEERALTCHDELLKKLIEKGYYPYRLSTHAMGQLPLPEQGYESAISKIKQSLDPDNIFSPGRYEN